MKVDLIHILFNDFEVFACKNAIEWRKKNCSRKNIKKRYKWIYTYFNCVFFFKNAGNFNPQKMLFILHKNFGKKVLKQKKDTFCFFLC